MKIQEGEFLKVKNYLGIMTIQICEEIKQTKDVNIMNSYGNLGQFNELRVEFYEEGYITLYSKELINTIYLIIPPFNYDKLKVFKCKVIQTEQKAYNLNRIEVE